MVVGSCIGTHINSSSVQLLDAMLLKGIEDLVQLICTESCDTSGAEDGGGSLHHFV